MAEKRILLASASPRRRELLRLITPEFDCAAADSDESLPPGILPREAVIYLSRLKARAFLPSDRLIIGADTVVALENRIIGKPADEEDAFCILKSLSGREHSVFTGVTVLCGDKELSFCEETRVLFYTLSDEEIKAYIKTGECLDKAGAYGIQGRGSLLVEKIDGDYFNVVGLPVAKLYRKLKSFQKQAGNPPHFTDF